MEQTMTKEQVIETTINVLGNISAPVRLKDQVINPIEGAIYNLRLVLQMIELENEKQRELDNSNEKSEEEVVDDDPEQTGCSVMDSDEA